MGCQKGFGSLEAPVAFLRAELAAGVSTAGPLAVTA